MISHFQPARASRRCLLPGRAGHAHGNRTAIPAALHHGGRATFYGWPFTGLPPTSRSSTPRGFNEQSINAAAGALCCSASNETNNAFPQRSARTEARRHAHRRTRRHAFRLARSRRLRRFARQLRHREPFARPPRLQAADLRRPRAQLRRHGRRRHRRPRRRKDAGLPVFLVGSGRTGARRRWPAGSAPYCRHGLRQLHALPHHAQELTQLPRRLQPRRRIYSLGIEDRHAAAPRPQHRWR